MLCHHHQPALQAQNGPEGNVRINPAANEKNPAFGDSLKNCSIQMRSAGIRGAATASLCNPLIGFRSNARIHFQSRGLSRLRLWTDFRSYDFDSSSYERYQSVFPSLVTNGDRIGSSCSSGSSGAHSRNSSLALVRVEMRAPAEE